MSYVLLDIGCAECRHDKREPLIEEVHVFETLEQAKEFVAGLRDQDTSWAKHPAGGEFSAESSGDYWIAPSKIFAP